MGLKIVEFKEPFRRYDWLDNPRNDRVVWDAIPGKYIETPIEFRRRTDTKRELEYRDPPKYSTDIAEAWLVVSKLNDTHTIVFSNTVKAGEGWTVSVFSKNGGTARGNQDEPYRAILSCEGEAFQRATCLAALEVFMPKES